MMHSIPIHASTERRQNAILGQLEFHSNRRLFLNNERQRQRQRNLVIDVVEAGDTSEVAAAAAASLSYHPATWRRSLQQTTTNTSSASNTTNDQDDTTTATTSSTNDSNTPEDPLITSVELSNCHLVLYSGDIALGSDGQNFRVDFDTASSDLWVAGTNCTDCPTKHPTWRLFNATASTTYQPAAEDVQHNAFHVQYDDGEMVRGDHAMDTLWIGDETLRIDHQVFAVVSEIDNFATCEEEEGIVGLANSLTTSHLFPTLLSNFLLAGNILQHNVFSMYLQSKDDYPDNDEDGEGSWQRQSNPGQQHHPLSASSQLVLGGVDQTHYLGCLQWHSMLDSASAENEGDDDNNYWSLPLQQVKVGGRVLDSNQSEKMLAILDSGSSYLVGPQQAVAQLVAMNKAKCFTMENFNGASPKQVPCNQEAGFDGAILSNCDDPFFNLEFVIGGITYVLEKEDLMVTVETLFGNACILRIVGSQGMTGWVLGDAFLNKYYAAFDFEKQRIGLALAAESAMDICEADMGLDINAFWEEQGVDLEDFLYDDEYGQEDDTITITTEGQQDEDAGNSKTEEAVEVFDFEDADPLPIGGGDEDFDFSVVASEPTITPVNDATGSTVPPPSHNEPPEREPVPHAPSNAPVALSAASLPESANDKSSSSGGVAIYVVAAAVISLIVAFVVRKTRRRRQQAMFQDAWREAEKEIVKSHRNLNYRDHEIVQKNPISFSPYRDGGFHDEETPRGEVDFDEEEEQHRNTFVLDTVMLDRMN